MKGWRNEVLDLVARMPYTSGQSERIIRNEHPLDRIEEMTKSVDQDGNDRSQHR